MALYAVGEVSHFLNLHFCPSDGGRKFLWISKVYFPISNCMLQLESLINK
jgi:hypothetical protein